MSTAVHNVNSCSIIRFTEVSRHIPAKSHVAHDINGVPFTCMTRDAVMRDILCPAYLPSTLQCFKLNMDKYERQDDHKLHKQLLRLGFRHIM